MAAMTAQRLCPTWKVPAPLPAGVTLAVPLEPDPEPLAAEALAPEAELLAEAEAEEAADPNALEAEASTDEIRDESSEEMDEETPGGTLRLVNLKTRERTFRCCPIR